MSLSSIDKFNKAAADQPLIGMLVYSFVGFFRPAIYIILLPLYLKVFSEAEYGLYDLMMILSNFLMILVTLRMSAAMLTLYYDYFNDTGLKRRYLRSLFSGSLMLASVFGLLSYFSGESLFDLTFKSDEVQFFPFGFLVVLYALLSEANSCYYTFLKNEKDLLKFVFIVLFQIILVIIGQLFMIIVLKKGVEGALLGMLIANVLTTLMIVFMERDILTFRPDREMIKASLKFSIPLIPYLMIYWFLTKGGKIILERYSDLETVGLFALLMTLAGILILITEAVISGIRPFLFEIFATRNKGLDNSKIKLLTRLIINIPLLFIPIIILIANNIHLISQKEIYQNLGQHTSLACLVIYVLLYSKLFYQQLVFVKKSQLVTLLSFVAVLFLFLGFYLWAARYQIDGVLYATGVANVVMAALFYLFAQRHLKVDYNFVNLIVYPSFVFGLLFAIEYFIVFSLGYSRPIFGILQFILLTAIILVLNYSSIKEYKLLFMK